MSARLRVGHPCYLNCLPLFTNPTLDDSVTLITDHPNALNVRLQQGNLDIGLVSSWAYLNHTSEWTLIPGFCIAAYQRVLSVNLYHRIPLKHLDGQMLAITPQSSSSAQLIRLFCEVFWDIAPEFIPLPSLELATEFPAFLLIGDEALTRPQIPGYQTYDLAYAWYEKTLLPMTFAVMAVREEVLKKRGDEVVAFSQQLDLCLALSEKNMDDIISLAESQSGLSADRLREYYSHLRYRMRLPEWNGLRAFATLASRRSVLQNEAPRW